MKRLTLHRLASSLHCFIAVNTLYIHAEIAKTQGKTIQQIFKGKDVDVFWLCYGNYEKLRILWEIATGNFSASSLLFVNIFFVKALRQ